MFLKHQQFSLTTFTITIFDSSKNNNTKKIFLVKKSINDCYWVELNLKLALGILKSSAGGRTTNTVSFFQWMSKEK